MSETAVLDKPADEAGVQTKAGAEGAPGGAQGKSDKDKAQAYLGTYKTKEDAEKGYAELNQTLSRYQSERDQAKAELEKVNSQVLAKLTDAITHKGEAKGQSDTEIQAEIDKAAAEIEEGGGKAAIQWMSRYAIDARAKAKAEILAELSPKLEALEKRLSATDAKAVKLAPEYQAYKSEISALMSQKDLGITDEEQALKIARAINPTKQPARPAIPGNSAGDKARSEDEPEMSEAQASMLDAELARFTNKPLTQAEKKVLAKKQVKT